MARNDLYELVRETIIRRALIRELVKVEPCHVLLLGIDDDTEFLERIRAQLVAEHKANPRMELPASVRTTSQVLPDHDLSKIDSIMVDHPTRPDARTWEREAGQWGADKKREQDNNLHRARKLTKKERRKLNKQKKRRAEAMRRKGLVSA